MLCSVCKNEQAVIFIHEQNSKDSKHTTGYCLNCARKKGINPLQSVLGDNNIDLNNVAEQFETMFNNISNNMELSDMDFNEAAENMVPIGAIFGNIFNENNNQAESKTSGSNKKVKVDKKTKEKKKKFLDTYGTNLTNKAIKNELDEVIGRNIEIKRIIQILNRRTKNNPCLIGEPGVGKTAIAQGLAICIAKEQ
ncbi:MAG: ATP-dependent Clp protease ATP-binding subunit, partial [Clostridia bacterium]|nr:ATP-dependent Clp protease ATP-binding subunit [Clostridia bacterium]